MKTKHFFLFYIFDVSIKTGYFNTGFVSLRYKNTNQYQTILIKICRKINKFFKGFFRIFFILFFYKYINNVNTL